MKGQMQTYANINILFSSSCIEVKFSVQCVGSLCVFLLQVWSSFEPAADRNVGQRADCGAAAKDRSPGGTVPAGTHQG